MVEFQLFQLSQHIGVHPARDLGSFNFFVGFGEAEILFNFLASLQEFRFLIVFSQVNGFDKELIDFFRQLVFCDVKILWKCSGIKLF